MKEHPVILPKDNLPGLLRKLKRQKRLVAPLRNQWGDTLYSEVVDVDDMNLDLENQPQGSLKSFFLPQQEVLFSYQEDDYQFHEQRQHQPTVFFGIRSCDLHAVLYMDMIFSSPGRDSHYFARRDETVLISLACNQPFRNCFCNGSKSGPFLEYGYDLQLTDLGDCFLVEVGRGQGELLLRSWAPFFEPASDEHRQRQYQLMLEARGGFRKKVEVEHACSILAQGEVDEELWQQLDQRCFDCGGCAYICPTCTCFTISDLPQGKGGERLRSWDACTAAGFTTVAGQTSPGKRSLRQRFLHKLKYDVADHGKPSCVGCGRCVDICFGHVDITTFIDAIVD